MKFRFEAAAAAVLVLCAVAAPAQASTVDELRLQAERALGSIGDPDAPAPTPAQAGALAEALAHHPRIAGAKAVTPDLVAHVVHDAFVEHGMTVAQSRLAAQTFLSQMLENRSPEATLGLIRVLLPYMQQAGMCSGDGASDAGATCAFFFVPDPDAVDVGASFEDAASGGRVEFPAVAPGTALAQILDPRAQATTDVGAKSITGGEGHTYEQEESYATMLGMPLIIKRGLGVITRHKCSGSCDVWGEVYFGANIKYAHYGSDTVMGIVPFGLHCDSSCTWHYIWHQVRGIDGANELSDDEILSFFISHGDPREFQVRKAGSRATHIISRICGVTPTPYQASPVYMDLTNTGGVDVPTQGAHFDVALGTFAQVAPANATIQYQSAHMFPPPTEAHLASQDLPLGWPAVDQPDWVYKFSGIFGLHFNFMFSSLANHAWDGCVRTVSQLAYPPHTMNNSFSGATASGNEFWIWHGENYTESGRGLPGVDLILGFQGGHLPVVSEPLPALPPVEPPEVPPVPTVPATPLGGTLQFSKSAWTVGEAITWATIAVTRSANAVGAASVRYSAYGLSATAGSDFNAVSGTLNWGATDTATKYFSVPILHDTAIEQDETVRLTLSSPTGGALGSPSAATLTILENDNQPGTLQMSTETATGTEGSVMTFQVTRTGGSLGALSVDYYTVEGSARAGTDYAPTSGRLNWAAGDTSTKSFTVTLTNDFVPELAENFWVQLSNATGLTLGPRYYTYITVVDND